MTDHSPTLDLTPPSAPPGPIDRSSVQTPAARAVADAAACEPPRTRWAAVIWGLLFAAISATVLWVTLDAGRRDAVADWVVSLSPPAIVAYLLLAAGAVALVGGLVGIARRIQRGRQRSAARPGDGQTSASASTVPPAA